MPNFKKIYEIITVDPTWDNWEQEGYYDSLTSDRFKYDMKNWVVSNLALSLECDTIKLVDSVTGEILPYGSDGRNYDYYEWNKWLEENVKIPDDFITEYAGAFNMCIDRPYITYREIVEECLAEAGVEISSESTYDADDMAFSVRGFVMKWPEDVADSLLEWEESTWQETVADEMDAAEETRYEQLTLFDMADEMAVGDDGSQGEENKEE